LTLIVTDGWLQGRNDDLERELNMLNEKDRKLEEDKNKIAEQYKKEYMELKTDRDAIIVQLKGFMWYYYILIINNNNNRFV